MNIALLTAGGIGNRRGQNISRDMKSEYVHSDPYERALDRKMKYRGLQIDIFPYEAGVIPSLYYNIVHHSSKARALHLIRKYICNPVLHFVSRLFGDKNMYMHSYGEGFPCRFPKSVLLPHNSIMFEGHEFPGPADPDRFCEILYHDYLNLPPLDKRSSHLVTYKLWD
jgi:lipopolysaccharide cholinephosphotransferase